jgi:hypothetical protein
MIFVEKQLADIVFLCFRIFILSAGMDAFVYGAFAVLG